LIGDCGRRENLLVTEHRARIFAKRDGRRDRVTSRSSNPSSARILASTAASTGNTGATNTTLHIRIEDDACALLWALQFDTAAAGIGRVMANVTLPSDRGGRATARTAAMMTQAKKEATWLKATLM